MTWRSLAPCCITHSSIQRARKVLCIGFLDGGKLSKNISSKTKAEKRKVYIANAVRVEIEDHRKYDNVISLVVSRNKQVQPPATRK